MIVCCQKYFAFFLLLYLHCYHKAKSETMKSLEVSENCYITTPKRFSTLNHDPPICTFEVISNFSLENIICPEKGVMIITGEYDVLHINCTTSFPLDFNFNGVTPTEAIHVNLRRTVVPNTDRRSISYHTDLKIYSVAALYRFYNASAGKNSSAQAYSRTGNYVFSGYHDLSYIFASIYIFFEEPAVMPDFIRNRDIFVKREGSTLRIPCRTTHYGYNVKLLKNGIETDAPYTSTKGFMLAEIDPALDRSHTCSFEHNGRDVVIVVPNSSPVTSLAPPGRPGRGTPIITSNLQPISFGSYGTKISCRISNLDSFGESALLTAIGASNAPMHKLTRDFTLLNFVSRSYSVLVGKRENDFKNHLKITTLIPDHVISAVCGNESIASAMSFGTTISCEIFPFTFDQEWSSLDRDLSNADRYFLVGSNDENNEFYENQEVTFKCRISGFIMTPPAVWYIKYRNGTLSEEYIDDDWLHGISHFTKKVTHETEQVICSASIWFKNEWWNMTAPIKIRHTEAPYFDEDACTKYEETFTINFQRLIRCKAYGIPPPLVYWQRNGKNITNGTIGDSIYKFQKVNLSHKGEYVCVAENYLGWNSRTLSLNVISGPDNPSTDIIIGAISAAVVAICVAVSIYVHFFKKKKGGLTKLEIIEFMEGRVISSYQAQSDAYSALTGSIPYDEQFEISQNRFQIDKTYILGSGAYGVVYKGLLDGKPVAVKTVKEHSDSSYLKSLLAELKVMIYLENHGNLIKLIGAYTKKLYKGKVYVFVDYCHLGSLERFLRTNRGTACLEEAPIYSKIGLVTSSESTITVKDLYNWSIQIAQGMAYLSKKKVIHGDLAARNVLLTDSRVAKITDFGLSRRLYDYAEYVRKKEERLPWRWLALESLKELSFSTRSDIWSYGVTLWEIFSLAETPYSGAVFGIPFVTQIENGIRLPPPQFASPELYNAVMMACWNNNPELRPSFSEISKLLRRLMINVKSPTTYLPNHILYARVSPVPY